MPKLRVALTIQTEGKSRHRRRPRSLRKRIKKWLARRRWFIEMLIQIILGLWR